MIKMNIEKFKKHTASRKPVCTPLRTGEVPVVFPKDIAECKKGELAMLAGEVLFVNLQDHNQVIMLHTDIEPNTILSWSGYKPEGVEIRLSRFKTNYDGMPNLAMRIWEQKNGEYVPWKGKLTNGSKVKCAAIPVKSKGKTYFNLHQDIILVEKSRGNKRRKVEYFSDEEI